MGEDLWILKLYNNNNNIPQAFRGRRLHVAF